MMSENAAMNLRPAEWLSGRVPMMKNKGRVRVGADADIVVFDSDTIVDKGTFEDPAQYSEGVSHVLVNGRPVLINGKLLEGVLPGEPIRAATGGS